MTVNIPNLGPRRIYFRHNSEGTEAYLGSESPSASPEAFSVAHRHPRDRVVKAIGRRVALSRLLDPHLGLTRLDRAQRRSIWVEYFRLHRDLKRS